MFKIYVHLFDRRMLLAWVLFIGISLQETFLLVMIECLRYLILDFPRKECMLKLREEKFLYDGCPQKLSENGHIPVRVMCE